MRALFGFCLLTLAISTLASCGGSADSALVGKWSTDSASIDALLGELGKKSPVPMDPKVLKEMAAAIKIELELKKDGTFVVSTGLPPMFGGSTRASGTWKEVGKQIQLTTKEVNGEKQAQEDVASHQFDGTQIHLSMGDDGPILSLKRA